MKRRDFLKSAVFGSAMLGCFPAGLQAIEREIIPGRLERRSLGRTGRKLSIIGFGGLVLKDSAPEKAAEWVRLAYEAGVNYFDVAPSYGNSEERLGPALEPYRKEVFLACKTGQRKAGPAREELQRSLKLLRTDYFDLYQLHAVTSLKEVDEIFSPDGAMKLFEEARAQGKVRLLGFSAHSVEASLALMERFKFDSILFPVNYATWHAGNFGPQVLEKASAQGVGILALKAMAQRPWPKDADRSAYPNCWYEPMSTPEEVRLGLGFTLSHPVTAAVHPADPKSLKLALEVGRGLEPLKPAEVEAMKARGLAEKPLFKYPQTEQASLDGNGPERAA